MKYIKIISVEVPRGGAQELGQAVGVVSADFRTNTAQWLCGSNPWGFHQDLRFAAPLSAVRQGLRIMTAAEKALEQGLEYIELQDEDYETLFQAVQQPALHEKTIKILPELMRALVRGGIVDAILAATNTPPST